MLSLKDWFMNFLESIKIFSFYVIFCLLFVVLKDNNSKIKHSIKTLLDPICRLKATRVSVNRNV